MVNIILYIMGIIGTIIYCSIRDAEYNAKKRGDVLTTGTVVLMHIIYAVALIIVGFPFIYFVNQVI